jgi:hypothetical protein
MLESQVGPPIEDVRLKWAAEPTAIIPPKQARRARQHDTGDTPDTLCVDTVRVGP